MKFASVELKTRGRLGRKPQLDLVIFKSAEDFAIHTVVLWLICRHRDIENSTYMKVILTKNLTFITIIYHTKFQFAKMSRTMKKKCIFFHFLVHKNHRNSENYIFSIVLEIFAN